MKSKSVAISLRLPEDMLYKIKKIAKERGVPYQTMMKEWLWDKVNGSTSVINKYQMMETAIRLGSVVAVNDLLRTETWNEPTMRRMALLAAERGNAEILLMLMFRGVDSLEEASGMIRACEEARATEEPVEILDMDQCAKYVEYPLWRAITSGDLSWVKSVASEGFCVTSESNSQALALAVHNNYPEIAEYLVSLGYDASAPVVRSLLAGCDADMLVALGLVEE